LFVVVLSVAQYLPHLGFYSDDWAFVGSLSSFGDYTSAGRSQGQVFTDYLRPRPTQAALSSVLFSAFGLEPLGYHVVNAGFLAAMTVLFYLVLRELRLPTSVSLTVPTVYVLLPHYTTDRFWFAAFAYTLGMALYFLSLLAELRAIRHTGAARWRWKIVALFALIVGGLGLEVTLPLLVANVGVAWYVMRRWCGRGPVAELGRARATLFFGGNVLAIALIGAFKASTTVGGEIEGSYLLHVARLTLGGLFSSYGTYGVALPQTTAVSARAQPPSAVALAGLLGLAVAGYVWLRSPMTLPHRGTWYRLAACGLMTVALGYSVFLASSRILFTSSGISNRVSIAAAAGVAMTFVAAVGWAASWLPHGASRTLVFCLGVGLLCGSGLLIISALAQHWAMAWDEQQDVLAAIEEEFPSLPRRSTIVVDGVCPYRGPAIVFESNWDLAGALEVEYGDPTVTADVVTRHTEVEDSGLRTSIYGDHVAHYPYSDRLWIFDVRDNWAVRLPNEAAARRYLSASNASTASTCPGRPGVGEVVFPFDHRWNALQAELYPP
jgi:hypothetical protein